MEKTIGNYTGQPNRDFPLDEHVRRAIVAAAPYVRRKSDWAALWMLLQERGQGMTETQLARAIAAVMPSCPAPCKQDIQQAEWDTGRRRFPHWDCRSLRSFPKFLRHSDVARAALPWLTGE